MPSSPSRCRWWPCLPLAFQKSTTGRLFIEFAVAVAGSVVISAFVPDLVPGDGVPWLLKPIHGLKPSRVHVPVFERVLDGMAAVYSQGLRWALGHRVTMVLVTVATMVLMVLAYRRGLEQDFLPQEDKSRLFALVITPNGSTSEFTDRQLRKAEAVIRSVPEVASYGAMVAPGFNGPGQASFGIVFVTFRIGANGSVPFQEIVNGPGGVAQRMFAEVEGGLAIANLPKAIEVSFNSSPFELVLQNQNLEALNSPRTRWRTGCAVSTNAAGQPCCRMSG